MRAELGVEVHRKIQAGHPLWNSELTLKARLTLPSRQILELRGRLDFLNSVNGMYEVIEVKSVCLPSSQFAEHTSPPDLFSIQTLLYAWLFWQNTLSSKPSNISALLLLVNLTDDAQRSFRVDWTPASAETVLASYAKQVTCKRTQTAATIKRRRRIAKLLAWPYERIRPEQQDISTALATCLAGGENILIEAPTGCGKTSAIILPALQHSLSRGTQTYYATTKSGGRSPASQLLKQLHTQVPDLRAMILSSQKEICESARQAGICEKCHLDSAVGDPGYEALESLFDGKLVTTDRLIQWAKSSLHSAPTQPNICPYRISRSAVDLADLVIGDINYLYDPAVMLTQFRGDQPLHWTLLLDEAHNIPDRARETMSVKISLPTLNERIERFRDDYWRYDDTASEVVLESYLAAYAMVAEILAELPAHTLAKVESRDYQWEKLTKEFGRAAGSLIARVNERLDPEVLSDLWLTFGELKALANRSTLDPERNLFFADTESNTVGITCLDSSLDLRIQNERFTSIAAFSATLSPPSYSVEALGLSSKMTTICQIEPAAISDGRLLVLHAPGIDTRLKRRRGSAGKVASLISRFARLSKGGVLAVFPSFDYIQLVAPLVETQGIEVVIQTSGMSGTERASFKRRLIERTGSLVAFAVAGGQFTEAEDFPADQITGVVVVGPCLPPPDFWKESIRNYHDSKGDDGTTIAYFLPALRKVVQAAGRMLRLESDRGIVLLVDDRYLTEPIFQLLPQGWQSMISRQSTDWETAAAEFWGRELPPVGSDASRKRQKRGRQR